MNFLLSSVKNIWAVVIAAAVLISGFQEYSQPAAEVDGYRLTAQTNYVLEQYLMRSQGVTTDGEQLFFSSNFFLCKADFSGEITEKNLCAVPLSLLGRGCDHIGGISYANGFIYAGIEQSGSYEYSYLAEYDAKTLVCRRYVRVPQEKHRDGIPWVAADAEKGLIYSSEWSEAESLNVYDLKTFKYLYSVKLDKAVDRIQGGEMYGGALYLSNDGRDGNKRLLRVDPTAGKVSTVFVRGLGEDVETEGMTITEEGGKPVFHIIDANRRLKTNAYLRSYISTAQ